jgi:hypothetical protein
MCILPLSDLHLETARGWDPPSSSERRTFDVLVMAGDVIPRAERAVRWPDGMAVGNDVDLLAALYASNIEGLIPKVARHYGFGATFTSPTTASCTRLISNIES